MLLKLSDYLCVSVSCFAASRPSPCSWTAPPAWAPPWQVKGSPTTRPPPFLCSSLALDDVHVWREGSRKNRRVCVCVCVSRQGKGRFRRDHPTNIPIRQDQISWSSQKTSHSFCFIVDRKHWSDCKPPDRIQPSPLMSCSWLKGHFKWQKYLLSEICPNQTELIDNVV